MDDPQHCSICHQPLHRMKHLVAHEHECNWDAEVRTCPHNIYRPNHFSDPRHDEWHHGTGGWVKRES